MMSQQRSPHQWKEVWSQPNIEDNNDGKQKEHLRELRSYVSRENKKKFKLLTADLWVDLDNYKSSKKEVKRWILARLSQHMKIPLYAHSKFDRVDNKDVNHTRPYLNFNV